MFYKPLSHCPWNEFSVCGSTQRFIDYLSFHNSFIYVKIYKQDFEFLNRSGKSKNILNCNDYYKNMK